MKRCLALLVILCTILVWPFLKPGFFPTHDGEWAVVRQGAMHRAFLDHQIPARWAGNLNYSYGYPLFLFTYPLPYYLGEVFNVARLGLVNSVKLLFIASVFLSVAGMFLLAREFFGNFGGLVSSIFYLYAPYRLVNLYVRGSLGESLSFVLYPFLFWAILKTVKGGKTRFIGVLGTLFGMLILTHNASALLFTPFLFAFIVMEGFSISKNRKLLIWLLLGLFLGFLLSAFFTIPALLEKKDIVLNTIPLTNIKSYFATPAQLIVPSWGYGSFGDSNGLSLQLGWVHLLSFSSVLLLLSHSKNRDEVFKISLFSTIAVGIVVLLVFPISLPFWQFTPLFSVIDFPWRVLGPGIFFLSLPLGFLATRKNMHLFVIVLLALVVLVTMPYAKPKSVSSFPDGYYLTNEATTTSADELMPKWVKEKPKNHPAARATIISGKGEIGNVVFTSSKLDLTVRSESSDG
jgi:uncharacterized membrane protein